MLEQVDEMEGIEQVAVTEHEVLVVLDAALAVQVDVEQLARPERLGDAGSEVQAGHLLVTDFRVQPDHVAVFELGDEGEGVADGRQQDVTTRLVRLRLDREPDAVVLLEDIGSQRVDRFAVAVEGSLHVLDAVVLGAFPPAPEDIGLRAELGGEVDVAGDLGRA